MVPAALEGDGRHFSIHASFVSGLNSMAEGTNDGENGTRDNSSSDEAALSARLGSLDHRLSEIRGSRKIGTDQPGAGSGDGAARASAMARGFRLSSELIAGVVVGAVIGWGFDRLLSTSPWGLIVFFLLGFAAGVVNVMRSAGVAPDGTLRK
jgi:ATP synthase protein I